MSNLSSVFERLPELSLAFLGGAPVVYHCNHFNLFLDQTVDDALGAPRGVELRTNAAREASHALLSGLNHALGANTAQARLELAEEVFASMGHGRLDFDVGGAASGSWEVRGETLHYGICWSEKYGHLVRRHHPADAFAAGFCAAAIELAHDLRPGSMTTTEYECITMRAPLCRFRVAEGEPQVFGRRVGLEESIAISTPVEPGLFAARVDEIERGLCGFLSTVEADSRGLIQAFGVFVTRHLASYYNNITYTTFADLVRRAPALAPVASALFQESGHVCVFNTFGGILLSPEWEGMVGSSTEPAAILSGCVAIARALGFGRWEIEDFVPGERLCIRTPLTYEHPWLLARGCDLGIPAAFFLQGAVLAIMQLIESVDWAARPKLDQGYYDALFRRGTPWKVDQSTCVSMGDPDCRVVVERQG